MPNRRSFIKNSILASSSLLIPKVFRSSRGGDPAEFRQETNQPLILSTWNHGVAANERAWEVLEASGSILNAVEEGVRVTEADGKTMSVGLHGYPDREGIVTLDASIMKGDGSCGSVAFVRQIKHPITLARKVMEKTPHVMLVGRGAQEFAIQEGIELEEEKLSEAAKNRYREWKEEEEYRPVINADNHDTIGMIGLDENGNLAGSCTTSGTSFKMHGRVGDSPIIGSGLYVDDEVGAATATGLGEAIIRINGSFLIVELMRQGYSPHEACREAVERLIKKHEKDIDDIQAGFIAINKEGEHGAFAVRDGFDYAMHTRHGNDLVESPYRYS